MTNEQSRHLYVPFSVDSTEQFRTLPRREWLLSAEPGYEEARLKRVFTLIVATAAVFLVLSVVAPAAQATSLAPAIEPALDGGISESAQNNPTLIHSKIKFLETEWHFGLNLQQREALSDQIDSNLEAFDRMERAPWLYTDGSDTAEAAAAEPEDERGGAFEPPYTRTEIKFLEDNWHLGVGTLRAEDDPDEDSPANPALTREEIQFLEDNWHFDSGSLFSKSNEENAQEAHTRPLNKLDRADQLEQSQEETRNEGNIPDRSDTTTLTHPWGGNPLTPAY